MPTVPGVTMKPVSSAARRYAWTAAGGGDVRRNVKHALIVNLIAIRIRGFVHSPEASFHDPLRHHHRHRPLSAAIERTNEETRAQFGEVIDKFEAATSITTRFYAPEDWATSDLAVEAARLRWPTPASGPSSSI